MASVTDVYNRISDVVTGVETVHNDLITTNAQVAQANQNLAAINSTLQAGFAQMMQGFAAVVYEQQVSNLTLLHISKQADAILCAIEHVSKNTCAILTESHRQTEIQERLLERQAALTEMFETAYPAAALTRAREEALRAELRRCCKHEPEPPACTYEPCPAPEPLSSLPSPPRRDPPR